MFAKMSATTLTKVDRKVKITAQKLNASAARTLLGTYA